MQQAINCPKDNCNGILEEGVRGFYKCTVCGAKVKKSLVESKMVGSTVANDTKKNKAIVPPVVVAPKTEALTVPPVIAPAPVITTIAPVAPAMVIEGCIEQITHGAGAQVIIDIKPVVVEAPKPPKAPKENTQKMTTKDGIVLVGKTTVIKCIDCGAERIIKIQDAFQVKRCVECQKTYTKARRADKAKEKRASAIPAVAPALVKE